MPVDPAHYNYRRQALDALHFARLVDRFWQNLRRAAGYKVQYFGAVEPQRRLVPHLHAAIRGAIPRATIRQVVAATYLQLWWPSFDRPVYVHRTPVWDGEGYVDADTGEVLPTWAEALDQLERDPDAKPAHVMRFGRQVDMAGIIAPSEDADRAVRYLTKYLTKAVADTHTTPTLSRTRPSRRTSTGCTPSCATCPAPNGARTGCATASNPTPPAPVSYPAAAHRRRTTANTSASVAAASWSPASGPVSGWPSTRPTAPPSSAKPSSPPASSPPKPNASPRQSPCLMGRRGSCGPTPARTPAPTPASSWPRSLSGNAGGSSTKPRSSCSAGCGQRSGNHPAR